MTNQQHDAHVEAYEYDLYLRNGGDCDCAPTSYDNLWVPSEYADDEMSLEERWEHYAFEERNNMAYGSSF